MPVDGGAVDATVSPVDGGGPNSTPVDGATDAKTPADAGPDVVVSASLSVTSLSVRNVGRRGDALRVSLNGADKDKRTTSVVLRMLDSQDAPVIALDTNWDGVADASEKRFRFETSALGKATFTGVVTIPSVYAPGQSTIAKVVAMLEDATGARSQPLTASLAVQPVREEFDFCDVAKIADRCADGLSCSGATAKCVAGVAPTLTKTAYFGGAQPRMLFRGSEPDDDLAGLAIEFLDAAGNPKSVDLIGDGSGFSGGFPIDAIGAAEGGQFFLVSEPIVGFDAKVPKIAVVATDEHGHAGPKTTTSVSVRPVRAIGQACDFAGFDVCAAGAACAPGLATATNTCAAVATLKNTKCGGAPVLDPAKGATVVFGKVEGASLWDAPQGCVTGDATGRPEAALKLHLASPASSLTLSTALPETDFDTSIYLVPTCASAGTVALGCNDDDQGASSTLTLTNVPAGDYVVIVDAVKAKGGTFGLSVDVK